MLFPVLVMKQTRQQQIVRLYDIDKANTRTKARHRGTIRTVVLVLTHVGPVLMQHVMHHAKSKNLKLAAYHRFPNETKAFWIDFQSTFPR